MTTVLCGLDFISWDLPALESCESRVLLTFHVFVCNWRLVSQITIDWLSHRVAKLHETLNCILTVQSHSISLRQFKPVNLIRAWNVQDSAKSPSGAVILRVCARTTKLLCIRRTGRSLTRTNNAFVDLLGLAQLVASRRRAGSFLAFNLLLLANCKIIKLIRRLCSPSSGRNPVNTSRARHACSGFAEKSVTYYHRCTRDLLSYARLISLGLCRRNHLTDTCLIYF